MGSKIDKPKDTQTRTQTETEKESNRIIQAHRQKNKKREKIVCNCTDIQNENKPYQTKKIFRHTDGRRER